MTFEEHVVKKLLETIGSSEFLIFINGLPKVHNRNSIYVKSNGSSEEPDVVFFTKFRQEGKTYEYVGKELRKAVLDDLSSGLLFTRDFGQWVRENDSKLYEFLKVSANNNLKFMYLETIIYNIFRSNIPSKIITPAFVPQVNGGRSLAMHEVEELRNKFRLNGFRTMIAMEQLRLQKRIQMKIPKFYRLPDAYFMAMFREDNLFNPLFDDAAIYENIKDRRIIKEILDRSIRYPDLGLSTTHLSSWQVCQSLGIGVLVPLSFSLLTSLLAGFVMAPEDLPISLPHKAKQVYRMSISTEEFPSFLTVEQYNSASEYQQSHYVSSTSYNTFILNNSAFFTGRGFRDMDVLIQEMELATLL